MINVKIYSNGVSWKSPPKQIVNSKSRSKNSHKESDENSEIKKLMKRYNRRISNFMTAVCSCTLIPTAFITLTVPRDIYQFESIEEEIKYFNKFQRYIRRYFPLAWFFYKYEWGHKNQLHIHLVGDFGIPKEECESFSHRKKMHQLWEKANGVKLYSSAYDQREYQEGTHIGYLCTRDKLKENLKCISLLGKKAFWGKVNRNLINQFTPISEDYFLADKYELSFFISYLHDYFKKNKASTYSLYRLKRASSRANFIPKEISLKLLEKARLEASKYRILLTDENFDETVDDFVQCYNEGFKNISNNISKAENWR